MANSRVYFNFNENLWQKAIGHVQNFENENWNIDKIYL